MARTFRHRHSLPSGIVARDKAPRQADKLYYEGTGEPVRRSWNERKRWTGNLYRREKKADRKLHQRQFRARTRNALRHEDWDSIPVWRRTGGWLSW